MRKREKKMKQSITQIHFHTYLHKTRDRDIHTFLNRICYGHKNTRDTSVARRGNSD